MHRIIIPVALATFVAALLPLSAVAQISVGSHVGAIQPTYARQGRVWGVGLATGGHVAVGLSERWRLNVGLDWHRLWDDTTSFDAVKFPDPGVKSSRAWTTTMLRAAAEYRPPILEGLGSFVYLGAGIASWKVETYPGYRPIVVGGGDDGGDFAGSELALVGGIGIEPRIVSNVHARLVASVDGFTGLGASMPDEFYDDRTRVHVGVTLGFSYQFGSNPMRMSAPIDQVLPQAIPIIRPDFSDMRPHSDYPYLSAADSLTQGPSLSELYSNFLANDMPPDGDRDGIADQSDRCPSTPAGFAVDACGCLQLTRLDSGFTLHVRYASGWSDIDHFSSQVLDDLAIRLKDSTGVSVLVEGYTDNVGTDMANQLLSRKRASRVRDYLVARGIATARVNAVGRGEANSIADNGTAEGRRRNRRIEITFTRPSAVSASTGESD